MKELKQKLLTAMLLSCVMLIASQTEAALIAHYGFDTSLTNDDSGNTRTLTAVNSPNDNPPSAFGVNGVSLTSGSQQYLYAVDSVFQNFGTTDDFAVSLWYRRANNDSNLYDLIGNGDTDNIGSAAESGFTLQVSSTNASPTLSLLAGGTTVLTSTPTLSTPDDDAYQHVVFQRDGGVFQLYVNNGTPTVDTPVSPFDLNTTMAFAIGASQILSSGTPDGPPNFFNGLIDEVFVFDTALTTDEIEGLFTSNTFPGINGGGSGGGGSGGVPEPTSLALLSLGLLFAARRKRRVS